MTDQTASPIAGSFVIHRDGSVSATFELINGEEILHHYETEAAARKAAQGLTYVNWSLGYAITQEQALRSLRSSQREC